MSNTYTLSAASTKRRASHETLLFRKAARNGTASRREPLLAAITQLRELHMELTANAAYLGWTSDDSYQEFTMSARNGDKSRFNRERKQKIARRKRIHKMLGRAAKGRKAADATIRAQPQLVSA